MNQERKNKRIKQIEAMIQKVEKSTKMRFIFDGEEMFHDFDMPGDMYKTMQKVKAAVIDEFKADIRDLERSTQDE